MKHSGLALAALSSLLLVAACHGATRPHYGGTLHVSTRAAINSLDPANEGAAGGLVVDNVTRLIFDTLVTLDDKGNPQPSLAVSWEAEPGNQRWAFNLRSGVKVSNGSLLTAEMAAASLRTANPKWKVTAAGNAIVIEDYAASPQLLAQLGLARNAIALRDGNKLAGTGPFVVADWQSGKKLTLSAREDYWNGRPFLDSVEIEMGRSLRDQMIALDLGKAELIDIAADQAHRSAAEGRRVASSAPVELVALVFSQERGSDDESKLRKALGLSIDRNSLNNVILQGGGAAAGGMLPDWLSGYGFLFPIDPDLERARELRDEVQQAPAWTLGYDGGDAVARLLAERVALNARDAGLRLQPTIASNADIRLMKVPISSVDAQLALSELARRFEMSAPVEKGKSADELYQAESSLLASQRVIPLLHVRVNYGLAPTVKNWTSGMDGRWDVGDVWLGTAKP